MPSSDIEFTRMYGGPMGSDYGGPLGHLYGALPRARYGESWTVELRGPGTTRIVTPINVDIGMEHSALWDATVTMHPLDGLDTTDLGVAGFAFGEFDLYYGAEFKLGCTIDSVDTDSDGALELTGRERPGLELTHEEITVELTNIRAEDAIRKIWRDHSEYEPTVYAPPDRWVADRLVQEAHSKREFEQIFTARPRDEQGRFVETSGGDAPPFLPTDPLQLTNQGVEMTQICILNEAENPIAQQNTQRFDHGAASNGYIMRLLNENAKLKYEFSFDHDIPEGGFAISFRARIGNVGGGGEVDQYAISVDGSQVVTRTTGHNIDYTANRFEWSQKNAIPDTNIKAGETHTVTFEKLSGDDQILLDLIAFHDLRYPITMDDGALPDANGALPGPELYPAVQHAQFDQPATGVRLRTIDINATVNTLAGPTPPGFRHDSLDNIADVGELMDSTTDSIKFPIRDPASSLPLAVDLRRYDDGRNRTPTNGNSSHILQSFERRVTGSPNPFIEHMELEGTVLDIQRQLHEFAGYNFALEHGKTEQEIGQTGPRTVESFEAGEEGVVRDIPTTVLDENRGTTADDYANRVTVIGAEKPPALLREGEAEHFRATAEDEGAIADLGGDPQGVRQLVFEDSELKSDNECKSKAQAKLRAHNSADVSGSVETIPRLIEPGYPHRVPQWPGETALDFGTLVEGGEVSVPANAYSGLADSGTIICRVRAEFSRFDNAEVRFLAATHGTPQTTDPEYSFFTGGEKTLAFFMPTDAGNISVADAYPNSIVPDNEWVTVNYSWYYDAGTDETTVRAGRAGRFHESTTRAGAPRWPITSMFLGGPPRGQYAGQMSDFQLFDHALSESEIVTAVNGYPEGVPGLRVYYPMDGDGAPGTVIDHAGTFDGVVNNVDFKELPAVSTLETASLSESRSSAGSTLDFQKNGLAGLFGGR